MQKLLKGVHHFQTHLFSPNRKLFAKLAKGQRPLALFITCSDSRINPNLITHTEPGDLFILRNAGNIVPPYGAAQGGEGPTIEYAVMCLGVRDIVVCGHTLCGAMNGLLNPESVKSMPSVAAWLKFAEATRRIVHENYANEDPERQLNIAIQENVLRQLENLQTHPAVAAAVSRRELTLHGWVYKIETGQVFAYSVNDEQFVPIEQFAALTDARNNHRQKVLVSI
jgi:carbonic anhydrase